MIDNAVHAVLVEAADNAGWDEDSMLLMATRFIAHLSADDPAVVGKFKAYLEEQVSDENAECSMGEATGPAVIPAKVYSDDHVHDSTPSPGSTGRR